MNSLYKERLKLCALAMVAVSFGWPSLKFDYEMQNITYEEWNEPDFSRRLALFVLCVGILVLGMSLVCSYKFVIGLVNYMAPNADAKHRRPIST